MLNCGLLDDITNTLHHEFCHLELIQIKKSSTIQLKSCFENTVKVVLFTVMCII